MKNHIFVQGRMGSTRLPSKILMKICNKTIIEIITERLKKVDGIDKIVLLTGPETENKLLIEEASRIDLDYFCGSKENLLDRFYQAGQKFNSNNIIRVTADCPLIDFNLINKGLEIFTRDNYDILSVGRIPSFPHGLDFEIFTHNALSVAWKKTIEEFDNSQQFVDTFICPSEYILKSSNFKKYDLVNSKDMSSIRITLDYLEDFELISKIYETLYYKKQDFVLDDIINLLEKNSSMLSINKKYAVDRHSPKI